MAFELLVQQDCVKGDQTYVVKLYFDADTNTQKHEYVLNDEVLFYIEYEAYPHDIPDIDLSLASIVEGFDLWYEQVGPDWRPEAF
jgi:hypothetical protein